jgi:hypothetical protein
MPPIAITGAVQKSFVFFSGDRWRDSMSRFQLIADDETGAAVKYVATALMPYLSDERFRLVTPAHWFDDPQHPLVGRARHADGDGYDLTRAAG